MPNPCWYHILWNSLVDSAIFKTSFQNSGLKWLVFKSGGHLALADGGVLLCCYRVKEGRCTCPSEVKKAIWYVQLHQLIYEKKIVWLFSTVCFQKCPSMLPSKIKDWVEIPWEQLGTDSEAINPWIWSQLRIFCHNVPKLGASDKTFIIKAKQWSAAMYIQTRKYNCSQICCAMLFSTPNSFTLAMDLPDSVLPPKWMTTFYLVSITLVNIKWLRNITNSKIKLLFHCFVDFLQV